MLSLQSQILLEDLHHPFQTFTGQQAETSDQILSAISDYSVAGSDSLPCDIQLVDSSPLPSYEDALDDHSFFPNPTTAILIRRVGYDGQFLGSLPLPECITEGGSFGEVSTLESSILLKSLN